MIKMTPDEQMKNSFEIVKAQNEKLAGLLEGYLTDVPKNWKLDEGNKRIFARAKAFRPILVKFCTGNNVDLKQQLNRKEFVEMLEMTDEIPDDMESYVGNKLSLIKLIKDRQKGVMKISKKASNLSKKN